MTRPSDTTLLRWLANCTYSQQKDVFQFQNDFESEEGFGRFASLRRAILLVMERERRGR